MTKTLTKTEILGNIKILEKFLKKYKFESLYGTMATTASFIQKKYEQKTNASVRDILHFTTETFHSELKSDKGFPSLGFFQDIEGPLRQIKEHANSLKE